MAQKSAYLALMINRRAMSISELVSETDRTEEDFRHVHRAFVAAALDADCDVASFIANDPKVAAELPNCYSMDEIDPVPTTKIQAEEAANDLVANLIRVAQSPLLSVTEFPAGSGKVPKMSLVESARLLIAVELAGVWKPRANAVRDAALARGHARLTMPATA